MDSSPLLRKIGDMRKSFFDEQLLDSQFVQLEELEEMGNPNFVHEVIKMYFKESVELITSVEEELGKSKPNFLTLEKNLHQFKGSSGSVGAHKVMTAIDQLRECLKGGDLKISKVAFQHVKEEQETFRSKLATYFELKEQIQPVEIVEGSEKKEEGN